MNIPEEDWKKITTVLNAEECNGFGFPWDSTERVFIFARLFPAESSNSVNPERVTSFLNSLMPGSVCVERTGVYYCKTPLRHYPQIRGAIQALIDSGMCSVLPTGNLSQKVFRKGDTFSWREMELGCIETYKRLAQPFPSFEQYIFQSKPHFSYKKHWNWHTPEGKEFCSQIRDALYRKPKANAKKSRYKWDNFDATCVKYGLLHRAPWSAYEPSMVKVDDFISLPRAELAPASQDQPVRDENDNDGEDDASNAADLCMICMDAPADTLVVPCMHSVVCRSCSSSLKDTRDSNTCVRCRRAITEVYADYA